MGILDNVYNIANDYKHYKDQRAELEYQHALQERIFEREDTVYQRTVQDMLNAGLNPLTMQGTNGAGEAIATSAPDLAPHMQTESIATKLEKMVNSGTQIANTFDQLKNSENERKYRGLDYLLNYGKTSEEIENLKVDTETKRKLKEHMEREYKYMEDNHLYDYDEGFAKQLKIATAYFMSDSKKVKEKLLKDYPVLSIIDSFLTKGEISDQQMKDLKEKHPFFYMLLSSIAPEYFNEDSSGFSLTDFFTPKFEVTRPFGK